MKLSIIIPVYNEEKTIDIVLNRVMDLKLLGWEKEVIVVDDGSKDGSQLAVKSSQIKNLKFFSHKKNQGKGAAIKTGIEHATGDFIVIQDADTEYNPEDIKKLVNRIKNNKESVVYGTRLHRLPNVREDRPFLFFHYFGNRFLSFVTSVLYGEWLTDMETCYKLFPKKALENIELREKGFSFEPEITAKLLKNGYKVTEVPISTTPRDYNEGKKLQAWKDGPIALWTLLKYRFIN